MFIRKDDLKPFEKKIWLSSPTMHGEELEYVTEAFDTNWIAPLGPHVDGFEKDIESADDNIRRLNILKGSHSDRLSELDMEIETFKNKNMPGHMGAVNTTVLNLEVVKVIAEKNLILVKGGIPGANKSTVVIRNAVKA